MVFLIIIICSGTRLFICQLTLKHFIYEYSDNFWVFMKMLDSPEVKYINNYNSDSFCLLMFIVQINGKKYLIIMFI